MEHRRQPVVLDPEFLIEAYTAGFFPMADPGTRAISWYSPDPRAILPIGETRFSPPLRRQLRAEGFEARMDTSFEDVIRHCSMREETWISGEIIDAYLALHTKGAAHSIEVWQDGELAGGLYGVAIGGAFFGESMVSLRPNASKAALFALAASLRSSGFVLHDIQFMTGHLERFGAVEVSRREYIDLLHDAIRMPATLRLCDTVKGVFP